MTRLRLSTVRDSALARRWLRRTASPDIQPTPDVIRIAPDVAWRVLPAPGVVLAKPARPSDRELHLRVLLSALSNRPDAVDHVEVSRDGHQLGVQVWVRERVAHRNEAVPLAGLIRTEVVQLNEPVGNAKIVNLAASPPKPLGIWETKTA
ncbi:hypothetical protein F0L68_14125 [Solihabitans fulvus]|uniref:Uncharacterized protein n=1 Tax=Solihabitans fulvus TaxID=1892852 RepID=A0A5B2XF49_9PSEU|nr:hypothetical protein [Solihabitans fulvus]KAA2262397.1 hypothetical protein F0L68_14125 [Solihabitans fulvus]